MEVPPIFERIEVHDDTSGIPDPLRKRFTQYPITAPGDWQEDQLTFRLRWEGGYANHLNPSVRATMGEEYRNRWLGAVAPKTVRLNAIKDLPMPERKTARRNIMPFPGVLMTFERFYDEDGKLVIGTRVGNYAQIHPDFGICTPSFITRLRKDHRRLRQISLWRVARGMGVQVLTETADNYHIFGLNTDDAMGAGFIGTLGITPEITDEQMQLFVRLAGNKKTLDIPGVWLNDSIKKDLSEPDELNLESRGLQDSAFDRISVLGAIPDPKSGWMTLIIACKLNITTSEVESLWPRDSKHQYQHFLFVKDNPQSLISLLSRPTLYPALYGGYHAYFRTFHPKLL